jgi:uncharacterized protein with gpF-like domain
MSRFSDALKEAIRHFTVLGFTSPHQVDDWSRRLEAAAEDPVEEHQIGARVASTLQGAYTRATRPGSVKRAHPGIEEWMVHRLEPRLRDELQRRIWAAADLIRLNRQQALAKTMARFKGFATSVPTGGTPEVNQRLVAQEIAAPSKSLDFITRRAQIDQTQKMIGNLNDIIADGAGAIAATWDHVPELERQFRPEHTARHGLTYPIRGSWAAERGLLRAPDGWWQDFDIPGQLINCRCEARYLYSLEEVPPEMLTPAGRDALAKQLAA